MKTVRTFLLLLVVLVAVAYAATARARSEMPVGAATIPPAGFIQFCAKYPAECTGAMAHATPGELGWLRRYELEDVQARINASLRPRTIPGNTWDYPLDGTADCNRYALAKRQELLARGWRRSDLLLAVAVTERGEWHLVLVVVTADGDFILDNRYRRVMAWEDLPYEWVSRQDIADPSKWRSLAAKDVQVAATR
jgi:predicted transglutaminase-like cysteine proteinase